MEGIIHIESEKGKLKGKRVLVRADLNIPGDTPDITHLRLTRFLKTLTFLHEEGAKTIILSHADPDTESLARYTPVLASVVPTTFAKDFTAPELVDVADGGVVLMENLRLWQGEELNDPSFGQHLATMGELYVNDAFSVSHREHASMVALPKLLPAYAGFSLAEEVKHLEALKNPEHPFVFIIAGAKFETKLPLIKKFLDVADTVFVGGALANSFLKLKGYEVGLSVAEIVPGLSELLGNSRLMLPTDVVVEGQTIRDVSEVHPQEKIFDAGTKSLMDICDRVRAAKTVIWNGPLGNYERGYGASTIQLAKCIAESGAVSIVGGGDTLELIPKELIPKFTLVSTGGGALLEYLRDGTLPALEVLKRPTI